MLLVRGLGVALLMLVDVFYLFGLLGAEMGIYLAYKVLMGDFWLKRLTSSLQVVSSRPRRPLSIRIRERIRSVLHLHS